MANVFLFLTHHCGIKVIKLKKVDSHFIIHWYLHPSSWKFKFSFSNTVPLLTTQLQNKFFFLQVFNVSIAGRSKVRRKVKTGCCCLEMTGNGVSELVLNIKIDSVFSALLVHQTKSWMGTTNMQQPPSFQPGQNFHGVELEAKKPVCE